MESKRVKCNGVGDVVACRQVGIKASGFATENAAGSRVTTRSRSRRPTSGRAISANATVSWRCRPTSSRKRPARSARTTTPRRRIAARSTRPPQPFSLYNNPIRSVHNLRFFFSWFFYLDFVIMIVNFFLFFYLASFRIEFGSPDDRYEPSRDYLLLILDVYIG